MPTDKWIARSGKEYIIKDMGTEHIQNCIKLLDKKDKTLSPIHIALTKELETRIKKKSKKKFELIAKDDSL